MSQTKRTGLQDHVRGHVGVSLPYTSKRIAVHCPTSDRLHPRSFTSRPPVYPVPSASTRSHVIGGWEQAARHCTRGPPTASHLPPGRFDFERIHRTPHQFPKNDHRRERQGGPDCEYYIPKAMGVIAFHIVLVGVSVGSATNCTLPSKAETARKRRSTMGRQSFVCTMKCCSFQHSRYAPRLGRGPQGPDPTNRGRFQARERRADSCLLRPDPRVVVGPRAAR